MIRVGIATLARPSSTLARPHAHHRHHYDVFCCRVAAPTPGARRLIPARMAASGLRRMVETAKDTIEKVTGAPPTEKQKQMAPYVVDPSHTNGFLTTEWGQRMSNTDDTLRAGARGPALLGEDFQFRDKMTRFDHESTPTERVVHARGSGAHGHFELYDGGLAEYTCAKLFTDTRRKTPVFVRFSTVLGSRGSSDTVRDVRGFATRFYTDEGNFDLVGNNIPVFFIQDAIKFPDVIHAGKPEPHWEIPQAQTAHDNFWDFISLTPETMHMAMWVLSDRAIPRSYRMMQGFGVNTYTLLNDAGRRTFVKFHWRPTLGIHSLAWDEAHKLCGLDPDYHRRDLWEAIEAGAFPEYELGLQLIPEADEHKFEFDILDDTKFIPEELVPIRWVGKMVLNRNPTEFWAETEHIAFCMQNVVRGIGFSNDPVLQGRLFSYLDTQLLRFHSPNFNEVPINQPLCPVFNHHRRGNMRMRIQSSTVNYWPNRFGAGQPALPDPEQRGYLDSLYERVEGMKERVRGPKFREHYRQAAQFYRSLSPAEQRHLVAAARFELGRCDDQGVRERMVGHFARIDYEMACLVADGIGVARPARPTEGPMARPDEPTFPSLAMERTFKTTAASRKVAILVAEGFNAAHVTQLRAALKAEGCITHVIAPHKGPVAAADGSAAHAADFSFWTAKSPLFDGVLVPGGAASVQALLKIGEAVNFINEAYKHCKPIGAVGEGINLLRAASLPSVKVARPDAPADEPAGGVVIDNGVVTAPELSAAKTMVGTAAAAAASLVAGAAGDRPATSEVGSSAAVQPSGAGFATDFIACLRQHRFWYRVTDSVPA